jgi:hypothetical protein
MATLSRDARQVIKEHGVTVAEYIEHLYGRPGQTWGGDVCGCPDDRCANGFHHAGVDDCRCLPVLLDDMINARKAGL